MSTPEQASAVVIGLREVYEQLVRLTSGVGELRADLRSVTQQLGHTDARLSDHTAADRRTLDDHETRLRGMERRLWVLSGFAAAAGTGGGWLASTLGG